MRVLWCGDAVVSSGFSRCTHAVCDELHRAGHEVHVIGINHYGDPHTYPYPIYPCNQPFDGGHDGYGASRLARLADRINPDVIVLLNDPWNVPSYLDHLDAYKLDRVPPLVAWLAVDGKNQQGEPLNRLSHVVTWTRFASEELRRGGYNGDTSIVPLGVDTALFHPNYDKTLARGRVCPPGVPLDAFIVGVVGRNQPRKRVDLAIQYFADWVHQYRIDDAFLYLHVAPTGDVGVDLHSLIRYYDVRGRVIIADTLLGKGASEDHMANVYTAFDCYLTTTQGEGWGLPCMEAMACSVPCIVPDFSGLGEWTADAAIKVPCTSFAPTAPINGLMHTIGGIADRDCTVAALHMVYSDPHLRAEYGARGLRLTRRAEYRWQHIGVSMRAVLEGVVARNVSAQVTTEATL